MPVHSIGKKAVVPEALRSCAEIYEERNKLYGDNYKRFGQVMGILFPNGINLDNEMEYNRYGIFVQMISKIMRYAENWEKGHPDSLDDLSVYSQMLNELDGILRKEMEK